MNMFVLHSDPIIAARMVCDKHCPKMIVESGQMLSTAHRMIDGYIEKRPSKSGLRLINYWVHPDKELEDILYRAVHHNHPCTIWTRESKENYQWHYEHFIGLCDEFEKRFGKVHATRQKLEDPLREAPSNMLNSNITTFPQAMKKYPECMVEGDPVQAYRNYYHYSKPFAKWEKGTPAPDWWEGYKGIAA